MIISHIESASSLQRSIGVVFIALTFSSFLTTNDSNCLRYRWLQLSSCMLLQAGVTYILCMAANASNGWVGILAQPMREEPDLSGDFCHLALLASSKKLNLEVSSHGQPNLRCAYWSIAQFTPGSTGIQPTNNAEILFAILVLLPGHNTSGSEPLLIYEVSQHTIIKLRSRSCFRNWAFKS
eukprot:3837426-Amphidinium_carterae.1